jgi:hypothetical protein
MARTLHYAFSDNDRGGSGKLSQKNISSLLFLLSVDIWSCWELALGANPFQLFYTQHGLFRPKKRKMYYSTLTLSELYAFNSMVVVSSTTILQYDYTRRSRSIKLKLRRSSSSYFRCSCTEQEKQTKTQKCASLALNFDPWLIRPIMNRWFCWTILLTMDRLHGKSGQGHQKTRQSVTRHAHEYCETRQDHYKGARIQCENAGIRRWIGPCMRQGKPRPDQKRKDEAREGKQDKD